MSDNRMSSMSEKTRRRRRVERLKLTIWMGLVLWVLISITTFIVMAIGMHSLNNKIKVLEENINVKEDNTTRFVAVSSDWEGVRKERR